MKRTLVKTMVFCLATATIVPLTLLAAEGEPATPPQLARLVFGKPAEEAADIAGRLLNEAIRLGGESAEIRRRIVVTTSVLISGVSREPDDVQAAVAQALMRAAGPENEPVVAATLAELAQSVLPDIEKAVEAAVTSVPEARRAPLRRAVERPRGTLGLRLIWAARGSARDTLDLMDKWAIEELAAEDVEEALVEDLSAVLPTTTTTTTSTTTTTTSTSSTSTTSTTSTSTTTTSTTRPSPTPVGRR